MAAAGGETRPLRRSRDADSPAAAVRRSKRERKPANTQQYESLSTLEYQRLQAAVEVSLHDKVVEPVRAAECPVFTPTEAEFRDPIAYMRSIAQVGWKYGIAKIVPPKGWCPGCGVSRSAAARPMPTRVQHVDKLQQAKVYDDGPELTLPQYKAMADAFVAKRFPHLASRPVSLTASSASASSASASSASASSASASSASASGRRRPFGATRDLDPQSVCLAKAQEVEDTYWRIVETQSAEVTVHYANDLDVQVFGSGFVPPLPSDRGVGDPDAVPVDLKDQSFYRRSGWNLRNLPRAAGSLLQYMETPTSGVNIPWLYVGMLFASFAWHTEDNYLYSINYMHYGTAKTWYGIPSKHANKFDKTVKKHRFEQFDEEPDLIHSLTTVISPAKIQAAGIPVFHTVQEPGEFVITFPRGYHSGFSHGFNIAEACNFALPDWIPMGRMALRHYETVSRETCFSHEEVIINAAKNMHKHDLETCKLLAHELRTVVTREAAGRQTFLSLCDVSPSQVFRLKGDEQRYNCAVSQRMCYVSAVVCQSDACSAEASKARKEAHKEYLTERKRLTKLGVDPGPILQPDPQHTVVKPRFADSLCDCSNKHLRMVTWFECEDLSHLVAALEERVLALSAPASAAALSAPASAAASSSSASVPHSAAHTPDRAAAVPAAAGLQTAETKPRLDRVLSVHREPAAASAACSVVSAATPTRRQAGSPSDAESASTTATIVPLAAAVPTAL